MNKKIKYVFALLFSLIILSCREDYILVEIVEQKNNLLLGLNYKINTTFETINLNNKSRHRISSKIEIIGMGSSWLEYTPHLDRIGETSYYNPIEKKIIVYFYYIKYGTIKINSLDTLLTVESFNNFDGYYTEYFIYNNNEYQIISKKPEMKLEDFVEEFDYEKINITGLSQYKIIGKYTLEDENNEIEKNENGIFPFNINYIFPEENNPEYIKYSLF
jgi:hypothetical protein